MSQQKQAGLRELTEIESEELKRMSRSRTESAEAVGRARSLVAVSGGAGFAAGARMGGRKSGYGVGKLIERFNRDGLNALQTRPSHGGHGLTYSDDQRAQVVEEFQRKPDREMDGTGTWSLTTLQRAVRKQPGLEKVSRDTICNVLHAAGLSWQRDRTWCETGISVREGKHGKHVVVDADMEAKKTDRTCLFGGRSARAIRVG